ncbi:MAG: RlmE family RNA methyltransferase [Holosporaceae bacterium]|jgi:23S rRNA (uridine2552-2'-O)-methyltransferase|nr:RlmE family RNA methyltransferase [Holosporaceae bacterium]
MKITGKMRLSSRMWLNRREHDPYIKKARSECYCSRAAYKLMEIDDRFHLIKKSRNIVDLGAAPGSWCQLLSRRADEDAKITAVDLQHFIPPDGITVLIGDFEDDNLRLELINHLQGNVDLMVSDMAPATVGHSATDHLRIMRLAEAAHDFACDTLLEGGNFVVKIFQGGQEKKFMDLLKKDFRKVHFFKPKSSRSTSAEIYMVALDFKARPRFDF